MNTDIALAAVAPDDERALRDWFALITAARAHDARSGTETIGMALLALPTMDNLDNTLADLVVAPQHRRRGVGRRLLTRLADAARYAGRVRLIVEAREPLHEPGHAAAFLTAAGARQALANQRRRLTLPPADPVRLDALAAQARAAAAGYELVQWSGDTPREWLDDVAALVARMSTDAPLDELHYGPEHYDAARIAAQDAAKRARGIRRTVTAARGPDGRLAAYTVILQTTSVAWYANQGDTIVGPEHRGHRLGMLVKLANLELVRRERPELTVIDTYNADSNPWMVSINEAMGYRPYDRLGEWELNI